MAWQLEEKNTATKDKTKEASLKTYPPIASGARSTHAAEGDLEIKE